MRITFDLLTSLLTPNVKLYTELIFKKRKILLALLYIDEPDFVFNALKNKLQKLNKKLDDFERNSEYETFRKLVSLDEENWSVLSEEIIILDEKLENYHIKEKEPPFEMEIRLESFWIICNTFISKMEKLIKMRGNQFKKTMEKLIISDQFLEQCDYSKYKKSKIKFLENKKKNCSKQLNTFTNKFMDIPKKGEKIEKILKKWARCHEFDGELKSGLLEYWGYSNFRPKQREIINARLNEKDVLAIMPTGMGKSLCYQLPAAVTDGTTIVVSPLLSLMMDQVWEMQERGIRAECLGSHQDFETEQKPITKSFKDGELSLIYVTPEKIVNNNYLHFCIDYLYQDGLLTCFVIDEAHCVSQWGHDFRKDYIKLDILRKNWPNTPILAITATASEIVKQDICNILNISNCEFFQHSFDRPNIKFQVLHKKKSEKQLVQLLKRFKDRCGIIYCLAIKEVEEVYFSLKTNNISCIMYHGKLNKIVRNINHQKWKNGKVNIIIATIAFGMGINKPNVRFVIHNSIPKSVEDYYQQAGRAGRDGRPSEAILLYSARDQLRLHFIITMKNKTGSKKNPQIVQLDLSRKYDVVFYCEDDCDCRRVILLRYFGELFDRTKCNGCDVCDRNPTFKQVDFTEDAKVVFRCIDQLRRHELKKSTKKWKPLFTSRNKIEKVLRGSVSENIQKDQLNINTTEYGRLKNNRSSKDIKRLLLKLLIDGYLNENCELNDMGGSMSRLFVNHNKVQGIVRGFKKIKLNMKQKNKKKEEIKKKSSRKVYRFIFQTNHKGLTQVLANMLFLELKDIRSKLNESNISCLISDKMLHDIVEKLPTNECDLKACGWSWRAIKNYGEKISKVIKFFIIENKLI